MNKTTFDAIVASGADQWIPANGGSEEPTTYRFGRRLLYCFNPATGRHAYVDCETDIVLEDEEAITVISNR